MKLQLWERFPGPAAKIKRELSQGQGEGRREVCGGKKSRGREAECFTSCHGEELSQPERSLAVFAVPWFDSARARL